MMGCVDCSTTGQSSQFSTAHNINSVNPLTARRPPTDSRNATARLGGLCAGLVGIPAGNALVQIKEEEVKVEEDCVILDIPEGLRLNLLGLARLLR